jgi:hypothetical protein
VAQNYQFEIETYYKNYDNIYYYDPFFWTDLRTDKYNNEGEPLYTESKGLFTQGKSKTYGLEVLLRKDRGAVTGWISYTLGRALYTIQGVNQNQEFTPRHDRTSILNVVGNIDVKNLLRQIRGNPFENDKSKWKIGFGLSYASGQPITIPSYVYTARQMPDQDFYHGYNLGPIEKNNFRLPAYIRFDFSVTFTKKFKSFTLEPFLHIFNATNRRNVWFINYDENFTNNQITQEIDPTYMLPVLPSLGVNIIF